MSAIGAAGEIDCDRAVTRWKIAARIAKSGT
jgi:hypothetical protein